MIFYSTVEGFSSKEQQQKIFYLIIYEWFLSRIKHYENLWVAQGGMATIWQCSESSIHGSVFSMTLSVLSDSMLHALKRKQKLKSRLVLLLRPRQTKTLCKVKFSFDSNHRGKQGVEDKGLEEKLKLPDLSMPWLSITFHSKPVYFCPIILSASC